MISKDLIKAIKNAWNKDTCYPLVRSSWNQKSPEVGQCAVTALVIQDRYHGKIVYNSQFDHYWNILPGGKYFDLTKNQFPSRISGPTVVVNRKDILNSQEAKKFRTSERYRILKDRVRTIMSNNTKAVHH